MRFEVVVIGKLEIGFFFELAVHVDSFDGDDQLTKVQYLSHHVLAKALK